MTISFTASGNDVLFAGDTYTTETSAEAASEKAATLNSALKRVLAESNGDEPDTKGGPGVNADEGQFVPMGTGKAKEKADDMPEEEAAAKKPPATKKNPDPDNDGDDDTNAKGDTDHDYFTPGGKKK